MSFVDSLMVPASLHDVDGRFIHINAAAERASGLSREHLLGRHYTEPVSPEARQSVTEQFSAAHGFAGHPDGLASRAAGHAGRVGLERGQVDHGERGLQVRGGGVVPQQIIGPRLTG